jgi:hypothetical protein
MPDGKASDEPIIFFHGFWAMSYEIPLSDLSNAYAIDIFQIDKAGGSLLNACENNQ